jgi:hypothetical protein
MTSRAADVGPPPCARFSISPQAVVQRIDQQRPALRVVEQVVLEVGIALHDPDVAQHLVEHPRRASGATLAAQLVQQVPGAGAEQPDDDLPSENEV